MIDSSRLWTRWTAFRTVTVRSVSARRVPPEAFPRTLIAITALAITMAASPVSAQVASQPASRSPTQDTRQDVGWHVVREGQSLHDITAIYLGSAARWRENAALNPDLENPNLIEPGQRLRVLLRKSLPPRTALLVQLANRVESLLNPLPWQPSLVRQILREADAVRTHENASALLRFSDRSELTVTEESLVFVREGRPETQRRDPSQIEIRVGQADYSSRAASDGSASADPENEIEIVIGAATAAPKPDDTGAVRTRARVDGAKKAQLMVYGGSSALATPRGTVELAEGTGSSVSAEGNASPPEKLLAAPELVEPANRGSIPAAQADFRWQAVPGASSYVVEICQDASCSALVKRTTGIASPTWRAENLSPGRLFWRATAVSASGLDGYPSESRPFVASAVPPDEEAPYARIRFAGPQVTIPERFLIGPATKIEVETGDNGPTGVASWTPKIDGKAVSQSTFGGPWEPGPHKLTVEVVDGAGNRFEHPAVPFTFDPVPPILRWQGSGENGETQGVPTEPPSRAGSTSRKLAFEWAPGANRSWRKLVGLEGSPQVLPRVGVRPTRGSFRLGGTDLVISRKQPLWLEAEDPLCRAVHLSVLILDDATNGPRMVVNAVDLLGNTTRAVWPLHDHGGKKHK